MTSPPEKSAEETPLKFAAQDAVLDKFKQIKRRYGELLEQLDGQGDQLAAEYVVGSLENLERAEERYLQTRTPRRSTYLDRASAKAKARRDEREAKRREAE